MRLTGVRCSGVLSSTTRALELKPKHNNIFTASVCPTAQVLRDARQSGAYHRDYIYHTLLHRGHHASTAALRNGVMPLSVFASTSAPFSRRAVPTCQRDERAHDKGYSSPRPYIIGMPMSHTLLEIFPFNGLYLTTSHHDDAYPLLYELL